MTSSLPLVSIVIPTYQAEAHLAESIASVLSQNYPNIELLIIDGGSTDRTHEIVASFGERITYFLTESDHGMYDAMNKGIVASRGVLVKIHNADDVMPIDSAALAVKTFLDAGQIDCVIRGRLGTIDQRGNPGEPAGLSSPLPWLPRIAHPTWFVPRTVYDRHGLYATRFRVSGDAEMFFRLRNAGLPFIDSPHELSRFRSGGRSSGYVGVKEGFVIHQQYLGAIPAGVAAAWSATVKAPRLLLGDRIESPRLQKLRAMARRLIWQ